MWSSGRGGLQRSIELAGDGIGAVPTGSDVRCFGHGENGELRPKLERQLRLQPLDSPRQVSDAEESPRVDVAARINIIPVDVRQTADATSSPAARNDTILDRDVFEVLILHVGGGLDFDQTPAPVAPPMQDVHSHEHAVVLEHSLEDRRNFWVGD